MPATRTRRLARALATAMCSLALALGAKAQIRPPAPPTVQPTAPAGFSHYGKIDTTVGNPIDLALDDKTIEEVDYASAYPGLEVRRTNTLDQPWWVFEFDQVMQRPCDWWSQGGTWFCSRHAVFTLLGRVMTMGTPGANREAGIFDWTEAGPAGGPTFVDAQTDTRIDFAPVQMDPWYPYPHVVPKNNSYRIVAKRLRDGTTIRFEYTQTCSAGMSGCPSVGGEVPSAAFCANVTMRHAPSGTRIFVKRVQLGIAPHSCVPTAITLPDGSQILYSWTAVPTLMWGIFNDNLPRLDSVTYPDGGVKRYDHTTVHLPGVKFVKYGDVRPSTCCWAGFRSFRITQVTDEEGWPFATYSYDGSGRPISSQRGDPNNPAMRVSVVYADNPLAGVSVRTVTDAEGTVRDFHFQRFAGPRLVGVSAPCGWCPTPFKSIEYDLALGTWPYFRSSGLPSRLTDFRDTVTTIRRDFADWRARETSRTIGEGRPEAVTIESTWHPSFNLPTRVVTRNAGGSFARDYVYDAKGRPTRSTLTQTVKRLDGTTQDFTEVKTLDFVDAADGVIQQVIARSGRTDVNDSVTTTFDTLGRVATITDALGRVTTVGSYDAHGRARRVTLPNGVVHTRQYDWAGRLIAVSTNGISQQFTYYRNGLLRTSTTPGVPSQHTTREYDFARRLVAIVDQLGHRKTFAYDAMGRQTSQRTLSPAGAVETELRTTYANSGRTVVTSVPGIAGSVTTQLDAAYAVARLTDAVGRTLDFTYDALGANVRTVGGSGLVKLSGFDVAGNLASATFLNNGLAADARNQSMFYAANARGDVIEAGEPDTGTDRHTFDAVGNPTAARNADPAAPNSSTTFDALQRPTRTIFRNPAGATVAAVTFGYDVNPSGATPAPIGRLTSVTGTYGTARYEYDGNGRIVAKFDSRAALEYRQSYAYDAAGRLTAITYPSGRSVRYVLDGRGRPAAVQTRAAANAPWVDVATGITYTSFGAVRSLTWPNGRTETMTHDRAGRIRTFNDGARQLTADYHADGKLAALRAGATVLASYQYDAGGRIAAASGAFGPSGVARNIAYTFNNMGNLERLVDGGGTLNFTYPPNKSRVSAVGTRAYGYGARGVVVSDTNFSLSYNERGLLKSVVTPSGTYAYDYDYEGQRATKTRPDGTRQHFHYDPSGRLVAEHIGSAWTTEYVWLGDRPLALVLPAAPGAPERIYQIHVDPTEAPVRMTDAAGASVWSWQRSPFAVEAASGSVTLNLRLPGQYFDAETGYHYNRARYYDPRTGRYLQPDPEKIEGAAISAFTYANGDPVNLIDPTGYNDSSDNDGDSRRPKLQVLPTINVGADHKVTNPGRPDFSQQAVPAPHRFYGDAGPPEFSLAGLRREFAPGVFDTIRYGTLFAGMGGTALAGTLRALELGAPRADIALASLLGGFSAAATKTSEDVFSGQPFDPQAIAVSALIGAAAGPWGSVWGNREEAALMTYRAGHFFFSKFVLTGGDPVAAAINSVTRMPIASVNRSPLLKPAGDTPFDRWWKSVIGSGMFGLTAAELRGAAGYNDTGQGAR